VKLVHLVGFIIKKFVTMQHGYTNVKFVISEYFLKLYLSYHPGIGDLKPFYTLEVTKVLLTA